MAFQDISDEDTRPILEDVVWYLMVRFSCSKPVAIDQVYRYYQHKSFVDDDFIHHQRAIRIATHIYRAIFLQSS